MMSATLIVRHNVADFGAWRKEYDEADTIRAEHGCTGQRVLQSPSDPNDVVITHEFPSVAQAEAFVGNPDLGAAMQRAGVVGAPRIEIYQSA
jgi:quinol monooxygenase YgiN